MARIFYETRCKCKEEIAVTKKRKTTKRSAGKALFYPDIKEGKGKIKSKIFRIKYENKLSSVAKYILSSFQNKYFYYAVDDILYLLKSNLNERDNLLAILYSPVLSLHNNFSISFFDIWIHEIDINEVSKTNKFLSSSNQKFESFQYITIKFVYRMKTPIQEKKSLW